MTLQLNQVINPFEEFYGPNIEQMPLLIADGRIPMSVSGLMQRRLQVLVEDYSNNVRSAWWDNYFDTGDGIAYHPDGNIKIVLDAQPLRQINQESRLENGALVLPDGLYETLDGLELTRRESEKYFDNPFAEEEATKNPVLQALACDEKLLNEYSHQLFALARQMFNPSIMSLYVGSAENVPTMRLWGVSWLGYESYVIGRARLDYSAGRRLVGVKKAIA